METIEKDYYKVLGVSENADAETIKKAYKEKATKYHPDNNPNDATAEEKMKEAGEAYAILGDPNKRKEYDLSKVKKNGTFQKSFDEEMEDIFHSVFGFSYFGVQQDIKASEKAYDEYMQFLNELEEKLKAYGKTISRTIKELEGRRGYITSNEIQKQKEGLLKEYRQIEKNAKAFDEFQEFYMLFKDKYRILTSGIFNNMETYCDKKNRCKFTPNELAELKKKLENRYNKKVEEKTKNLSLLEEELQKRNLNLDSYFAKRQINGVAVTKENVTTYQLKTMLDSIRLMNEIDAYLSPLGITIEDYLKARDKNLEEIKHNELQVIFDTLKEHNCNHIIATENAETSKRGM